MRIQEVILKESFSEEQLLLPCYAGEVKDAKDTSRLLRLLGDAAPLQLFGLKHLKRVRKMQSLDDPSDRAKIEVFVCPVTFIGDIPDSILSLLQSPLLEVSVCKRKPQDTTDRDKFGKHWPVIFRPTELSVLQTKGLSIQEEEQMIKNVSLLFEAVDVKDRGAVIVNPQTNKVVMTTKAARDIVKYKIEQGYSGKANALLKLDAHPLYTSVMLCIEGVAAIVRGDTKDNLCGFENSINVCSSTPETDQYVCTGLDIYLVNEPNVMEAMALVHSRIRRVIFLNYNTEGALGSALALQQLPSLNHHFRVFRGVNDLQ